MKTTLFLIRHAATPANLAHPAKLQGRRSDPELAPVGVRQAGITRDFLAVRPFDVCYCSPLRRAMQTAAIIAQPHHLTPIALPEITECDVGDWEGRSWEEIRRDFPDEYRSYMNNPAEFGYLGGETFAQVHDRARKELDDVLQREAGKTILIVSHHIVNRTYLAGLLGLEPRQARKVSLDNCGISIVHREGEKTTVATLNAAFHLQGLTA